MVAIAMGDEHSCLWIVHRGLQSEFCELHVKPEQFKLSKFDTLLHFYVDLLLRVCGKMRVGTARDDRKSLTF